MVRTVARVLVVEDNRALLRTLKDALAQRFDDVRTCESVSEALRTLDEWTPDLLIIDFQLPDGDARPILDRCLACKPAPAMIAISGTASPGDSFDLARRGVRSYLPKPITLDELEQAIALALDSAPELSPHLRQLVGHRSLAGVTAEVRATMIDEALARASGNMRGAARLLETSRQLLQYLRRNRQ
ncbi:MAG: response regulator [Kofleriaceae bacterium]